MKATTIPLGFAVPSGDPIAIPVGHMAVVGQTQAAGKTTTLEACAARIPDEYAVLAFVTKRGEGGFTNGVLDVPPYFRERADWEYVSSILEATLRERMKFERSWIMRACKGAQTLNEVHQNVKRLMLTAKGLSGDIYYQLDHYLDKIVPQITELGLRPGLPHALTLARTAVNVMDLSAFSGEMQALIIASCLETAYKSFKHTVIVIPEAWEFLPRARKSPVTYAAELYIRKGGALKNFLWIDSQDLAGVHTPVLKQVQIWLLGVQREINEVKRTLAHIHGAKKPKVDAIAALGLGQFIACFGEQVVTTYVQPAWMQDGEARRVAQGDVTVPAPRRLPPLKFTGFKTAEEHMIDEKLKAENTSLRAENEELRKRIDQLEARIGEAGHHVPRTGTTQADFQKEFSGRGARFPPATAPPLPAGSPLNDLDYWPLLKSRILADAEIQVALVKITTVRPELVVEMSAREVAYDTASPRGRLAKMIAQGLLDQPVKPGVIVKEYARTGQSVHPSRLSEYLGEFVSYGMVTREDDGTYVKTPGLKVTTRALQVTA